MIKHEMFSIVLEEILATKKAKPIALLYKGLMLCHNCAIKDNIFSNFYDIIISSNTLFCPKCEQKFHFYMNQSLRFENFLLETSENQEIILSKQEDLLVYIALVIFSIIKENHRGYDNLLIEKTYNSICKIIIPNFPLNLVN